MYAFDPKPEMRVTIAYRNHRGVVEQREITPLRLYWGSTQWHPEPQYLLHAYCHARREERAFAMRDVLQWGDKREGRGEAAAEVAAGINAIDLGD